LDDVALQAIGDSLAFCYLFCTIQVDKLVSECNATVKKPAAVSKFKFDWLYEK